MNLRTFGSYIWIQLQGWSLAEEHEINTCTMGRPFETAIWSTRQTPNTEERLYFLQLLDRQKIVASWLDFLPHPASFSTTVPLFASDLNTQL